MSRALLLALAFSPLACASSSRAEPARAPSEAARASSEGAANSAAPSAGLVSVKPGVNDHYFEADAVERYTDILERERREVIAHRAEIVAALELREGMVLADVGAGTGAFMAALSAGVGDSGRLYAVDIAPRFVTHLRERAAQDGLRNVVVVEGSATQVRLPEASVDLIFLCDVYHHIEYPAVYLRSLAAALRPGGRLVIVEFDRVPGVTSEAMMKHVRQDQATLEAELAEAGFRLEREVEGLQLKENYMLVFGR